MGEFYEACRGLGDMARAIQLPFLSGNVSFYNESIKTAVPPTPELLGIGIIADIRKCVTADFKNEGNPIYIVGKQTEKELGGSEYYKTLGLEGGVVPRTDAETLKNCMDGILSSIENGYIASCHDVSEGGIGICLSEMAISGDIGADIDISEIGDGLRTDFKLFSESNTRWIAEVKRANQKDFENLIRKKNVRFYLIGETKGEKLVIQDNKNTVISLGLDVLRHQWKSSIWDTMG
jgi:phosphoribosylformylglycinamidine synthase